MKTRSFVIGLVVCAVVFIAIGVVIRVANAGHHRPEGAAERWLAAVSDTTREGVRDDARERADKIGPLSLAFPLLTGVDHEDKGSFDDLEVGKATVAGQQAFVRYRLHVRNDSEPRSGILTLQRDGDTWHVLACCGEDVEAQVSEVPSEGGPPPASAGSGLWLVAILAGVGVTAGASLLVEWAARSSRKVLAPT